MIVTESFVFLHVPKTGGHFVQAVIRDHLPVEDYRVWTHTPYSELPARWQHLPAAIVVRNPWDWYVSWFQHQARRGQRRNPKNEWKQGIWDGVLRYGEADFREAITRACTGPLDHPVGPLMRDEGIDFYSAAIRTIAGAALDRPDFTAMKFERLRDSLLEFLSVHVRITPELRAGIRDRPPKLVGQRGPYPGYYDEELAKLVGEKAGWLCERFGYSFDQRPT